MDKAPGTELPSGKFGSAMYVETAQSVKVSGHGQFLAFPINYARRLLTRLSRTASRGAKAVFIPMPPSLVIFLSVAVAVTLFISLVVGLTSAQISGDITKAFRVSILLVAALPIALLTTIFLSVIIPYRAYISSSTLVALVASYSPYVFGVLVGIWAALWLGKILPFGYDSLDGIWKITIAVSGPVA